MWSSRPPRAQRKPICCLQLKQYQSSKHFRTPDSTATVLMRSTSPLLGYTRTCAAAVLHERTRAAWCPRKCRRIVARHLCYSYP